MEAARKGDTTAVRAVVEKLPPDSKTVAFDAAHETCRGNHDECLALLLPHVETTQVGFGILLSECVHANHVACTEVLLQHWKSVCSNEEFVRLSALCSERVCPTMWSDPAVCRVLIDAGADIATKDEDGRTPLHYACYSGALDVVEMLVEEGAGVRVKDDSDGVSPLDTACESGALNVVKMLVGVGAGVCVTDNAGFTCLIRAARFGHTETVRYLVGLPQVEVNHAPIRGETALHCAVDLKHVDVVHVLIDAGAGIDKTNYDGRSPLHCACASGALDIVKILVRAGAGVRVTDNDGDTCLTLASYFGHTETVRYLVGLPEVDVNHRDTVNCTALHYAVEENYTDVAQVLIDAGADIEIQYLSSKMLYVIFGDFQKMSI